jgi:hypothetical protein
VYFCRVRAEGYFKSKDKFTREKTLTAGVYYGDYSTTPGEGDAVCELLHCLTSDKVLSGRAAEKMREIGIDLKALRECLEAHCPKPPGERSPGKTVKGRDKKRAQAEPRLNIKSEKASKPVKRPKPTPTKMDGGTKRWPKIVRMFNLPSATEDQMAVPEKGAGKSIEAAQPAVFPRIIRMFSRPEGDPGEAAKETSPKKQSKKVTKKPERGSSITPRGQSG